MSRRGLLLAAVLMMTIACEDKSTPTTPAPSQLDLSGRWATDITVQGISARMTWMLTQNSTAVSGPVLVSLSNGIVLLNGTLTGTLTGSSLPYTVNVGAGGVPAQPTCTGQFGGTMTVAATSMVGPMMLISSNCAITLPSNSLTLTRQ